MPAIFKIYLNLKHRGREMTSQESGLMTLLRWMIVVKTDYDSGQHSCYSTNARIVFWTKQTQDLMTYLHQTTPFAHITKLSHPNQTLDRKDWFPIRYSIIKQRKIRALAGEHVLINIWIGGREVFLTGLWFYLNPKLHIGLFNSFSGIN